MKKLTALVLALCLLLYFSACSITVMSRTNTGEPAAIVPGNGEFRPESIEPEDIDPEGTETGSIDPEGIESEGIEHEGSEPGDIVILFTSDLVTGVRIVRNQETNIGNLCADAYRYISGADIAFVNGGGIRDDLHKGDMTREDILKIHPFGNMLSVCEATGREILDALEFSVCAWPEEFGGWLCPSGIRYEIHTYIDSGVETNDVGMFARVNGEYRVKNIYIGDEPLDLDKTYTVASPDYLLQKMGDGYTMFADNIITRDSIMLDAQVLITYITEVLGGVVGQEYAEPQGRIIFVEEKKDMGRLCVLSGQSNK